MLADRYTLSDLRAAFCSRDAWRPYPTIDDHDAWEGLLAVPVNRERMARLIAQAERILGTPWPDLPATLFMEFGRTGNRRNYEDAYGERRQRLAILTLAECFENKGRFVDEIANGVWAICAENTWHISSACTRGPNDLMPVLDHQRMGLFNCETGRDMAETFYLVGSRLDALSPIFRQLTSRRIDARILDEIETRDDIWWFDGHNNWTPWCSSSALAAAMFTWDDPDRLAAFAHKLMTLVDRWIAGYGLDGGCNEGPSYWGVAAGALCIFLELLYSRSDGAINIWHENKIRAMGEFIVRTHMHDRWFANFADAPAAPRLRPARIYRYGERVGSEAMMQLALLAQRNWHADGDIDPSFGGRMNSGHTGRALNSLFWLPTDMRPAGELAHPKSAWLPDVQVLVSRESTRTGEGLALATKGGHNAESHNHNDIGHVIVHYDGQPIIVDLGTEQYVKQTFSEGRYELWCIRGLGHNAPIVNGIEQHQGADYAARDVTFSSNGVLDKLTQDIAGAYPAKAGLKRLVRTVTLDRAAHAVTLADDIASAHDPLSLRLVFYARPEAVLAEPGRLVLAALPRPLALTYDASLLEAHTSEVLLADHRLREVWGERLYRILLTLREPAPNVSYTLRLAGA